MKIFLLITVCLLSGCVAIPGGQDTALVQKLLTATIPAGFVGNVKIRHKNAYTTVTIQVTGLRQGEAGWVWDSLVYEREGRFSDGQISLSPTKNDR